MFGVCVSCFQGHYLDHQLVLNISFRTHGEAEQPSHTLAGILVGLSEAILSKNVFQSESCSLYHYG